MTRNVQEQASHVRQEMSNLVEQMACLVEEMVGREEMVKGSVYERRRRCGRKGCRCQRGSLHIGQGFSYSDSGKTYHASLDGKDRQRLQRYVGNYRRFREARARLGKAWRSLLDLVNKMELLRRVPVDRVAGAGAEGR